MIIEILNCSLVSLIPRTGVRDQPAIVKFLTDHLPDLTLCPRASALL